MELTEKNVESVLNYALMDDPAYKEGAPSIRVDGVQYSYVFSPELLEEKREDVKSMLSQLKPAFFMNSGGGWSFLNLCETKDDELWTGSHMFCDVLYCLANALGMARFCLPRQYWSSLRGGMPYIQINLEGLKNGD